ncbi:MAG: EVE domain-containing protein [Minicystis sp.]
MKSEPFKYSFAQLVRDGQTMWDGVRNFEARNSLRAMKAGDLVLFYHSNEGKAVVGVARIKREAYADPTAPGEDWSVVDVEPVVALKAAVSLEAIRGEPELAEIQLLKRSRLSVVPVSKDHFDRILKMGRTKLTKAKPPAAEAKPAAPEAKPAAPEAKPAPKSKPSATKAKPSSAKAKPATPKPKPKAKVTRSARS